jgi:hypothetical protein
MYTIEPTDHWRPGDRAYCVRSAKRDGAHLVEAGRVYLVEEAVQLPGMMSDGLKLAGIASRIWSSRFVCLRGQPPYGKQMAERTRHGWYEAYSACRDAREAATTTQEGE